MVRAIAGVLDLSWVYGELAPYYSGFGRPSLDPVLMIRMLIVGYVFAIRSERALCRDVRVNLAYRWFCGLSLEDKIPDHSAFSRARNERFRDSDIFRRVFERVVCACMAAGLVGLTRRTATMRRGIAQMIRVGLYRSVHAKTLRSQKLRMLLTHRKLLQSKAIAMASRTTWRGTLRNFRCTSRAVRHPASSFAGHRAGQ